MPLVLPESPEVKPAWLNLGRFPGRRAIAALGRSQRLAGSQRPQGKRSCRCRWRRAPARSPTPDVSLRAAREARRRHPESTREFKHDRCSGDGAFEVAVHSAW